MLHVASGRISGILWSMGTDPHEAPKSDDIDPAELKNALGRTGRMLKTAGLPFELDEFDESDVPADAPASDRGTTPKGDDPATS